MMFAFLQKYGLSLAIGIAAVISALSVITHNYISISYVEAREIASNDKGLLKIKDPEKQNEAMRAEAAKLHKESKVNGIGLMIGLSEFMIGLAALLALIIPMYLIKDQPKKLIKSLGIAFGGIFLFLIFYALSSSDVQGVQESFSVADAKITGAIITLTIIGVIVAVLAIIGSEFRNFIQER